VRPVGVESESSLLESNAGEEGVGGVFFGDEVAKGVPKLLSSSALNRKKIV